MKTTRYKPWTCHNCGYRMDTASCLTDRDAEPSELDLTVCMDCAEPYQMHGGKWLPLTDDQLIDLPLEAKKILGDVQSGVREFNRQHKRKKLLGED